MNIARWMLSKFQLMHVLPISILICLLSTMSILAAPPAAQPEATPTVPAAAAEAGKDVVHQLNNAFAKVFEIVAPSVVIIEVSKKNEGAETSMFDDLFFQRPQQIIRERRILDLGLFADRRLDQSGKQRGPTLRHRRQSDRHEYADQRIEPRTRVCHSDQPGKGNRRRAHSRPQNCAAMARH